VLFDIYQMLEFSDDKLLVDTDMLVILNGQKIILTNINLAEIASE